MDKLTYDSITSKVTISVNGNGVGVPFSLQGGTYQKSINFLIGNSVNCDLDTLFPEIYTFDSLVNLGGLDSVSLVSSILASNAGVANSEEKNISN